jgi:hypothetical protein
MRRMTAVVAVCLCAVAGCRGGAAQEAYDGVAAVRRAPASAVPVPEPPPVAPEPIASEVDVPWTLALLSDGETRPGETHPAEARGDAVRDDAIAAVEESAAEEPPADLELAFDHDRPDEKPATSAKSCTGVVKGRS